LIVAKISFSYEGVLLRASPAVLSTWYCTVKLDGEKSKHAGLAQEIGFYHSIIAQYAVVAGKGHNKAVHRQGEKKSVINMI
jgi:hypothetical protein